MPTFNEIAQGYAARVKTSLNEDHFSDRTQTPFLTGGEVDPKVQTENMLS